METKKATALKRLYNGIMNDYSIQRYSLGWREIVSKIEEPYRNIPRTDIQFEDVLLTNAIDLTSGSMREILIAFGRELSINVETLREKSHRGTQRSPFGIRS